MYEIINKISMPKGYTYLFFSKKTQKFANFIKYKIFNWLLMYQ